MTQKSSKFDKETDKFTFWLKNMAKNSGKCKNLNFDLKKHEKVIKLREKLIILAYFSSFFPLF